MTDQVLTFAGLLKEGYAESDEALVLDDPDERDRPLVELLEEAIAGKQVTVRYWITDKQVTRDEVEEAFLKTVLGLAEVEWFYHYSDITGYMWTDEELNVGGHDLLAELKSHLGKWVILEIEVHASTGEKMYTKELLHKPEDQLTEYERQLRFGEGGDPRKLNPFIDQALVEMGEINKWNVDKVFQKAIRIGKGHANPTSLYELVRKRIRPQLLEEAARVIQADFDQHGVLFGHMTEAARLHHIRQNVMQKLANVTNGGVSLDDLSVVANEAVAIFVKANEKPA